MYKTIRIVAIILYLFMGIASTLVLYIFSAPLLFPRIAAVNQDFVQNNPNLLAGIIWSFLFYLLPMCFVLAALIINNKKGWFVGGLFSFLWLSMYLITEQRGLVFSFQGLFSLPVCLIGYFSYKKKI